MALSLNIPIFLKIQTGLVFHVWLYSNVCGGKNFDVKKTIYLYANIHVTFHLFVNISVINKCVTYEKQTINLT